MEMKLQEEKYMACYSLLLLLLILSLLSCTMSSVRGDLTAGFTAVELREEQFVVQKPYDVPVDQRYEFIDGVRRMWVYCSDKPLKPDSPPGSRTEIKINQIYNSGVWQFEGFGYVPAGTTGVSVMQVFGASGGHATILMLHVYDGKLMYYRDDTKVVDDNIYDRWFQLNVIHDVSASNVTVFIDGIAKLSAGGRGGDSHYFKFGVYTQAHGKPSHYMESRWKDVKIFTK